MVCITVLVVSTLKLSLLFCVLTVLGMSFLFSASAFVLALVIKQRPLTDGPRA